MFKVLVKLIKSFLLLKFLQTKPQIRKMNVKFYDSYYTVIKNRDDKEVVVGKYENKYINFNFFNS